MHQPCRSSARNHHPERAGGLKDWGLEGLGFEGFGDLNNCGVLGVWGFKGLAWSDAQPARSSGRNHHPGRVKFKGFRIRVFRAWGFKDLGALRILGVRILGFKVWPAWMPQPCRSSARNHHPGRAGGLKDDQVLIRVWVFEVWPGFLKCGLVGCPGRVLLLAGPTILQGLGVLRAMRC